MNLPLLAEHYRAAQFFAHNAHNLTKGATFFEDHEFLGELYGAYEAAYDTLVERAVLLEMNPDPRTITKAAADRVAKLPLSLGATAFNAILDMEDDICAAITAMMKTDLPQGTLNLLQGLADESEKRQFLMERRVS